VNEGLLDRDSCVPPPRLPETDIDFVRVRSFKLQSLQKACVAFLSSSEQQDFQVFCRRHADWLEDFTLFTAIQQQRGETSWTHWPEELRDRDTPALLKAHTELADLIREQKILPYFFLRQWEQLKRYCNDRGLVIFGDLPIYVSFESVDVWSHAGRLLYLTRMR